jgi:5-hydroxyisourate hydrolase
MSSISTHVLDAVLGRPAAGISVQLDHRNRTGWQTLTTGITDDDGRLRPLAAELPSGIYRLTFATADYLEHKRRSTIYPEITLTVEIDGMQNYHLPLLLSDNSYTTYRGS